MKLQNKKTGEVVELVGITCINGRTFVRFDDGKGIFKFEARSLAEFNEEWEDYEIRKQVKIIIKKDLELSNHLEIFKKAKVEYDKETHYLYIYDYDTGEQLGIFCVIDED